jgi:hypothetical protein
LINSIASTDGLTDLDVHRGIWESPALVFPDSVWPWVVFAMSHDFLRAIRILGRMAAASLLLPAALSLPLAAGCAGWNRVPEVNADEEHEEGLFNSMRSPTPKGQMTGLDARAREIEGRLGYR